MMGRWLHRLMKGACWIRARLDDVDPRVVRLSDPSRAPGRPFSVALLGTVLAVAIVVLTSTIRNAFAKTAGDHPPATSKKPTRQVITYSSIPRPDEPFVAKAQVEKAPPARTAMSEAPVTVTNPTHHPRFFDPILVFTEAVPGRASAYPLADPPGIVVDIAGVPEGENPVSDAVGRDDRIRSIKRRTTRDGVRYIIQLSTPLKRISLESEGRVVMVYPLS